MKRILIWLALVAAVSTWTGCNTTRGVGEDIERAGEKIQDATD